MPTTYGFILFSDLKGFSKLSKEDLASFYEKCIPELEKEIREYKNEAQENFVWNTWGDAIIAILVEKQQILGLSFAYRDFFRTNRIAKSLKLIPRISCHFGDFALIDDRLRGGKNAFSNDINTTARIEPITRPGEIFVSIDFVNEIKKDSSITNIEFDELGMIPLAKGFGEKEIFRLRKKDEPAQIIDKLISIDFSGALPEVKPIDMLQNDEINNYITEIKTKELFIKKRSQFLEYINKKISKLKSGVEIEQCDSNSQIDNVKKDLYFVKIVNLAKRYGCYKEGLKFIEVIEESFINVDNINKVYPFKYNVELFKIKANFLTRTGNYEEASNLIYGLWNFGVKDSDTLSMLAAQYKRKAVYRDNTTLDDDTDFNLLERAYHIYLQAFKLNMEDYYPVINAAYLSKILYYHKIGESGVGDRIKLSDYIISVWDKHKGKQGWWLDSTLAEAFLLKDDCYEAKIRFDDALGKYSPDYFERESTVEQIKIYQKLINQTENDRITEIIELIKTKY